MLPDTAANAFHAITAGLTTGVLLFALLAVVVRLILHLRGVEGYPRLATASDLSAIAAVAVALVIGVAAIVTGFLLWDFGAVINSPVMRNKLLTAALMVVTYALYLGVRLRVGPRLWENTWMAGFYTFLAIAGFHWGMVTSSIGGDIAGIPSGYETLVRLSGVETRFTYYLPTWMLVVMTVAAVVFLVVAFTDRERGRPPAPVRAGEPEEAGSGRSRG